MADLNNSLDSVAKSASSSYAAEKLRTGAMSPLDFGLDNSDTLYTVDAAPIFCNDPQPSGGGGRFNNDNDNDDDDDYDFEANAFGGRMRGGGWCSTGKSRRGFA